MNQFTLYKKILQEMVLEYFSGVSFKVVKERFKERYPHLKPDELMKLILEAYRHYKEQGSLEVSHIYVQNVERITQRINNIIEFDYSIYGRKEDQFKTKAYLDLLVLLANREKLCGFKVKRFKLLLNEKIRLRKISETSEFRYDLMSLSEQIDLLSLLKKMKKGDEEIQEIKENQVTTHEVSETLSENVDYIFDRIRVEEIDNSLNQEPSTFQDIRRKILQGERDKIDKLWSDARED